MTAFSIQSNCNAAPDRTETLASDAMKKTNDVPCIVETISDAVEARQVVLPAGSTVEDTHSVVRIVVSSAGMVVMISEVDVDCVEVVTSSKSVVVGVGVHSAINALEGQAARVGQGGDG